MTTPMTPPIPDRIEKLSAGERGLADSGRVAGAPGGFIQRTVDMTEAARWLRSLRDSGVEADYAHLVVHAAALALSRNPALHQTVCGYELRVPGRVDIGFSMPGPTTKSPVVLLGVDQKPLAELVPAMDEVLLAAAQGERDEAAARRASTWAAFFGIVRRLMLQLLRGMPWFQRWFQLPVEGTFHVSFAPTADLVVPFRFHTGSSIGAGRVRDVVVSVQGRVEIRPVMSLALVIDHVALDGMRAAALLNEIATILEGADGRADHLLDQGELRLLS